MDEYVAERDINVIRQKNLEIRKQELPEIKSETYNNYGNAPQIAYVDKYIVQGDSQVLSAIQELFNQQRSTISLCTGNELSGLNRQYYHLFVLAEEYYDKGVFSVAKEVTFKYTKDDIWKRYCRFDSVALQELMGMPAILATKNRGQGRTEDGHTFCLGKIDKITDQGGSFSMEFRTDGNDRKQQVLNDHCKEMGFCYSSMRTELDEIHWAIKEGDLLGLLGGLGI